MPIFKGVWKSRSRGWHVWRGRRKIKKSKVTNCRVTCEGGSLTGEWCRKVERKNVTKVPFNLMSRKLFEGVMSVE